MWRGMLRRCYSPESFHKNPTYIGCTVDEKFHLYQDFMLWASSQVGFSSGANIDKDLLFRGNKVYGPDTCIFVPQEINKLVIKSDKSRGEHPIGVSFNKHLCKFRAYTREYGKQIHLGYFSTCDEAFLAYKLAKESYVRSIAVEYKSQLDPRAYEALSNYEVLIVD